MASGHDRYNQYDGVLIRQMFYDYQLVRAEILSG